MTWRVALLVGGLAAAGTVPGRGPIARQPGQVSVFGASITLTRLRAAVVDDSGRPVPGLGVGDFRVLENGVEQEIQVVLAPEVAPLELAVVLDFSGSIAEDWPQVRGEIRDFLQALAPDDCLYLVPFNSAVGPGVWGRPADRSLQQIVERYPLEGRTRLYDAIHDALEALAQDAPARATACALESGDAERRRALVMLSDGMDQGSRATYADTLLGAWRTGVPTFPVAVGAAAIGSDDLRGMRDHFYAEDVVGQIRNFQGQLREIARVSGGSFVNQRDLGDAYQELLSLLRSYYVIGYRSRDETTEGWREVELSLLRAGPRVLAQPGVYRSREDTGAARDALAAAREAFEERRFGAAERWFGIAAGISGEVGRPYFGRALSLEAAGRLREARAQYRRSVQQNPGAAATHLRLARVSVGLGDLVTAREHAIRGAVGGGNPEELWRLLRQRGVATPSRSDLAGPVIFILSPEIPGLDEQLVLRRAQRSLATALDAGTGIALTRWYPSATAYLVTRSRRYDRGSPESLELRVELYDLGRSRLWAGDLKIAGLDDEEGVQRAGAELVNTLRQRLERR